MVGCIIHKELLLDDRMDSLREFLYRNKDNFDSKRPSAQEVVYQIGDEIFEEIFEN